MVLLVFSIVVAVAAQSPKSGFDAGAFDHSVGPQDDLYAYVNGAWLRDTSLPLDRVSYGAFGEIADKTETDLRALIQEIAARPNRPRGTPVQQIADLYASVVDERRIEELGTKPIEPELQRIQAIASTRDLAVEAGHLSSIAAGGPFGGTIGRDPLNSGALVARITQGGLLLPDRDYYLATDRSHADVRAKYEAYLVRLFSLLSRDAAARDAHDVLALETELARVSWTEADTRRAVAATYTRFTLRQLETEMPGFDWREWARPQGIDRSPVVILAEPSFFKAFAAMVPHVPLATWKAWLLGRYVTAAAPFLSSPFDLARFDFFGTVLTGQELPRTRWKRGVSMVNGYLGDAIGRLYVERYSTPGVRTRAQRILDQIVSVYRDALRDSDWMSPRAKREALAKLSAMQVRLGAPSEWHSYAGLEVRADDMFGNWQRALAFETRQRQADVNGSGALSALPPQTVNAFYSPASNEIVVPAAILQPPLFEADADDAVNYGSIGAVIGHEIHHAFDERGRQFDANADARDWWTADDEARYTQRTQRLIAQLDRYEPLPGMHVNGTLTSAEALADLGGLTIAYRAYRRSLKGTPAAVIEGFTGDQRFFMGWARIWRAKERDDYVLSQLQVSAHLPPRVRANAALVNVDAFYEAFGVTQAHRLYVGPADRVRIW
ncbi:MAG TPA: M13 family metallopeptidase [Vicinamibacterales bacterium]|nr:M13 family metallopeptidase [Vicinamibacterales bacterium]